MVESKRYRFEEVKDFAVRYFSAMNVPEIDARIAADVLLSADLRGINSHGVIRLRSYYGDRLEKGLINSSSPIKTLTETPSTLALDGGNGLGPVVAYRAMSRCIEMADETGLAVTTVKNSNHFGIAGYYAMMALPEDMIGVSLTNSQPLVPPTFGVSRILGTNPIAVAIPAGEEKSFVLDMATSIVPLGKISVYEKTGKSIPEGWAINKRGELTQNPSEMIDGGALLPLGGPALMRGYKGYGLSLLVDLLSGVLAGAAFGQKVGQPGREGNADVGHFFAALKIENFRPVDFFKADMDDYIHTIKNSPKLPGQERIYIHGEKEDELTEQNMREGLPLLDEIVVALEKAAEQAGIGFNLKPIKD
jgi:LDH2 family malate/lactate/ureidoglycolate dehydrogenase